MNITKGLKVGSLYHSRVNNKAVRLVALNRIEGGLKVATIKNHKQDHLFESEVYASDLSKATAEQVKAYFKR
jgi:hypothetical protein|tara:strand:+ start:147 stop:362 length:216 start_codon:yes stop_codon:yes gene_type:complete